MTGKKIVLKKDSIGKFINYIFVICLILDFYSVYISLAELPSNNAIIRVMMIVSVIAGVINKIKKTTRKSCIQTLYAIIITSIYVLIWYIFDPVRSTTIFMIYIQIIAIIIYINLVEDSFYHTFQIFSNIVLFLSFISLFFWLFGSVIGIIKPTGYVNTTWTGNDSVRSITSYYNIYFETQSSYFFGLSSATLIKNTAIFAEAPMASMVFSLAFMFEMLIREKPRVKRSVLLGLAIISTMSTTGVAEMVMCIGMRYLFAKAKKGKLTFKIVFVPVTAIASIIVLLFILADKLESISGLTRVDDFIAGYKAWMERPLFGNGYGNLEPFWKHISAFRMNNKGLANSIFTILVYGGVYLFIPYLYAAIKCINNLRKEKNWTKISFFIIYLFSFSITMCAFRSLTYYIFISMMTIKSHKTVNTIFLTHSIRRINSTNV